MGNGKGVVNVNLSLDFWGGFLDMDIWDVDTDTGTDIDVDMDMSRDDRRMKEELRKNYSPTHARIYKLTSPRTYLRYLFIPLFIHPSTHQPKQHAIRNEEQKTKTH